MTVLLVEDNDDDQFFFTEALSYIDDVSLYGVASNGREALEKLHEPLQLPDIIFTDIHMPVMDGIECLAELMKDPRTKNIPVIMLSSDTSKSGVACALGAKAFIKKTSMNSLKAELKQMLSYDFSVDNLVAYQTFANVRKED